LEEPQPQQLKLMVEYRRFIATVNLAISEDPQVK